jgi:hypothetical protein
MRRLLLVLLAAGCGGDSGTAMEGIYTVSTWTRNATACDVEGMSTASSHDPLFYIKSESFLGAKFVNVKDCLDVADCKALANDGDTIHIGMFNFDDGGDSEGWTNRSAFGFESFSMPGMCTGSVKVSKLVREGTGVRIEERNTDAVPFPVSSGDDECPEDKVEAAAMGQPCTELEVVTAAFNSDF